jgi:hypothetical protein
VLCVLSLGGATAGAQTSQPPEPALLETVGPDGHFSVKMPGVPEFTSSIITLPAKISPKGSSDQLNYFTISLASDNVAYILAYQDLPPDVDISRADEILEAKRDGSVGEQQLVSDAPLSLNGVPGRAYTIAKADGTLIVVHEFLTGPRLYQLIVVTSKGYTAPNRDAFLNSFAIR